MMILSNDQRFVFIIFDLKILCINRDHVSRVWYDDALGHTSDLAKNSRYTL